MKFLLDLEVINFLVLLFASRLWSYEETFCLSFDGLKKCGNASTWAVNTTVINATHVMPYPKNSNNNNLFPNYFTLTYLLTYPDNTTKEQLCSFSYTQNKSGQYCDKNGILGVANCLACENDYESNKSVVAQFFISNINETKNGSKLQYILKSQVPDPLQTITISACEKDLKVETTGQNSNFVITSESPGHFNDMATCNCPNDQLLVSGDGPKTVDTAKCSANAVWDPCQTAELQCWSAPSVDNVTQVNETEGAQNPFDCNYTPGFPNTTVVQYKLNGKPIQEGYTLLYTDDGKNFSCMLTSEYTEATNKSVSASIPITVYYPPKNSSLSESSLVIEFNDSKPVNFTFMAHPDNGSVSLEFKTTSGNADSVTNIYEAKDYTKGTSHLYELRVNVNSSADYGDYEVCAESSDPGGKDCSTLTIKSTDEEADKEQNIGIIVGAAAGGIVALLLIIAVIYFVRRKRGKNSSNKKEERINEIYESTPNPGPSTETVYTVTGNSQAEMKTNEMYEASPQQPEIQDVYTTVNRDNKLKGKKEKDSSENPGSDSTSAETNGPAVADVYAMVKK